MDGVPLRGESVTWGDNQEQWLGRNGAAQEEPARHKVSTFQGSRLHLIPLGGQDYSYRCVQVRAGLGMGAGKAKLGGQGECPPGWSAWAPPTPGGGLADGLVCLGPPEPWWWAG